MPLEINEQPPAYRFEWDESKNRQNIRKHGFNFADAEEMFGGILLFSPDVRKDYGESRWVGIAERGPETIRIISLRKATRRERKQYEKAVEDQLETS